MAFSISESVRFGWEKTKEHFGLLLAVFGIWLGAYALVALLAAFSFFPELVLHGLTHLVLNPLFALGLIGLALQIARGQKPLLNDFFIQGPLLPTYWLIVLVMLPVIFAAGALVFGLGLGLGITGFFQLKSLFFANLLLFLGFILALCLASLFLAVRFIFLHWALVDKKLGAIDCYRESFRLTRGQAGHLFLFLLCLLGLNFLGLLCFLVGAVVTWMVSVIAVAHVYSKLEDEPA